MRGLIFGVIGLILTGVVPPALSQQAGRIVNSVNVFGAEVIDGGAIPAYADALTVNFNQVVENADSVTSYRLVWGGPNQAVETPDCTAPLGGDDVQLALAAASYDSAALTAQLQLARFGAYGAHRLFLCVSSSENAPTLRGPAGQPLDGDGDGQPGGDFSFNFFTPLAPVKLVSPTGTIVTQEDLIITLEWPAQYGVTGYFIDVYAPGGVQTYDQRVETDACEYRITHLCRFEVLHLGEEGVFAVWLRPVAGGVSGPLTESRFAVSTPVTPPQSLIVFPLDGVVTASDMPLVWYADEGVTSYLVTIYQGGVPEPIFSQRLDAAGICAGTLCRVFIAATWDVGDYGVFIKGFVGDAEGRFAEAPHVFNVSQGAVSLDAQLG